MAAPTKRSWKTRKGEERTAWVARYRDGTGKWRMKAFPAKRAADAWLITARNEVARGTHTPDSTSVTVAEAARLWLERGTADQLEPATLRAYRSRVLHHIEPLLGGEKLSRLTRPRVESFVDDLLRTRSRAMTHKCLSALRMIINEGMRRGLVAQNVATGVRVRISRRKEALPVIPSKEELARLIDAAPPQWRPLLLCAAFTGLRASELRGLAWADVDLKTGMLKVRQRADETGRLGPPKSVAGRRTIRIPPLLLQTLREHKLASKPGPFVFGSARGTPLNLANIHNRVMVPIQERIGLVDSSGHPRFGLHSLRHWFASWLIDQGCGAKQVQVLMGHSSVVLTLDRYSHLFSSEADDHARLAAAEAVVIGNLSATHNPQIRDTHQKT